MTKIEVKAGPKWIKAVKENEAAAKVRHSKMFEIIKGLKSRTS